MPALVAFRVEASVEAGLGHVARCLALAAELRDARRTSVLVSADEEGVVREMAERAGVAVLRLPKDATQAGASDAADSRAEEDDADETLRALGGEERVEWIVVDDYRFGATWERTARRGGARVLSIDDLADRAHDCDLLLDQNLVAGAEHRYDGLVPKSAQRLIGPSFALLRPEFASARRGLAPRDGRISSLLVCFGGSDPRGMTELAVGALRRVEHSGVDVTVVVPRGGRTARIEELCERGGMRHTPHIGAMAEFLRTCDLVIGASGSSSWERMCMGVPSVTCAVAPNQEDVHAEIVRRGLGFTLGRIEDLDVGVMSESLARVFREDGAVLARMSEEGMDTVDGLGARRVARAMCASGARDADGGARHV